jgi:hypothetical protein
MVKKEKKTLLEDLDNAFFVEEYYEDEPISKKIFLSINDFYNLMHLIKKSWFNKKYYLKMENAGYNIYDKNKDLSAWIGIKEKCGSIMFIIYDWSKLYKKALKYLNGPMVIYNYDESLWIYSSLEISDIIRETSFEKQKEIIINWINKEINKIL